MGRNILAVAAAFVVGGICVFGLEWIGQQIYPLPEGVDPSNQQQLNDYLKQAPAGALLMVLLAQCAGSFVGGVVTGWLGCSRLFQLGLIYGCLALLMAALNVYFIPHPAWFVVLSLLLPIPLALLGNVVGQIQGVR
jgi:hypothetical protein